MKLNDTQLQRAAALADAIELSFLPDKEHCPKHNFSPQFEANMQTLIKQVRQNKIKPYRVFMGYAYYAKRSIAAVLIAFLLACVTVPEAVIAGYHKLIDVIEHVVTEYTEYKYHSTVPGDAQFVPLEFGYLPEGMEVVERYEDDTELYILLRSENNHFIIKQLLVTEEDSLKYIVDTEDAYVETKSIFGVNLDLIYKDDLIQYVWQYDKYHVSGRSNLPIDEVEKILNNLKIR
ncbi:MAG: DUF4367 domain-containing protein [Peptococcaceae bacterium]|nr:DUF4367 domain-containing protein [Peptococcaceae bacterium]